MAQNRGAGGAGQLRDLTRAELGRLAERGEDLLLQRGERIHELAVRGRSRQRELHAAGGLPIQGSLSPAARISSNMRRMPSPNSCVMRRSVQARAIRGFRANRLIASGLFVSTMPGNRPGLSTVIRSS